MQRLTYLLYNALAVPMIRLGFFLLSRFNHKARLGYEGRRQQNRTLYDDLERIPNHRKRILVHCTSVGEYEQAVPVLKQLKTQNPELFVVVSFFSASGYQFVQNNPQIDLKIYLNWMSIPGLIKS